MVCVYSTTKENKMTLKFELSLTTHMLPFIRLKKINPPFIINNDKSFIKKILYIIKNNKKFKNKSKNFKKYYREKYSMKNILKKFINENAI